MTRDQAQKIANDIFDAAESAGHLSKDLVADAIFNSWHKQTADNRKWTSTLDHMLAAKEIIKNVGLDTCAFFQPNVLENAIIANALMQAGLSDTPRFVRDMQLDD